MAEKLLVVGDVAIEMLMKLKRMPVPGEVCEEESYHFLPGGPAGNAALAASYFGVAVSLCSRVGKDGNATRLTRFFLDNGINIDSVFAESSAKTGMIVSFCEASYDQPRILRYRGACGDLSVDDVDSALRSAPDAVYLSPEVDGYIAIHTVETCDVRGIPVFLDASAEGLLRSLSVKGAAVKALYTTDKAAEGFTTMPVRDVETALKCCLTIAQKITADFYVIRMKNRGLFLYDKKTYNIIFVTDADEAAPKLGFADIESAVLAAAYMLHGDPHDACGVAAVADVLARDSKGFRIPNREQVAAYIENNGLSFHV